MKIIIWIHGEPQGKDRPRFNAQTKRTFTTAKTTLAEGEVRRAWEQKGKPRLPDDTPLGIHVKLFVVRPKGHYNTKGELNATGKRHPRPLAVKPDVDNAIKLIMDALNTRAYKDDVRVVEAHVERHWADWPATKISIYTLNTQQQAGEVD